MRAWRAQVDAALQALVAGCADDRWPEAARLLELGVYVVGFFYPVVPKGQARIRVQVSAVHDRHHLEKAVAAFTQAGRELGLIPG